MVAATDGVLGGPGGERGACDWPTGVVGREVNGGRDACRHESLHFVSICFSLSNQLIKCSQSQHEGWGSKKGHKGRFSACSATSWLTATQPCPSAWKAGRQMGGQVGR